MTLFRNISFSSKSTTWLALLALLLSIATITGTGGVLPARRLVPVQTEQLCQQTRPSGIYFYSRSQQNTVPQWQSLFTASLRYYNQLVQTKLTSVKRLDLPTPFTKQLHSQQHFPQAPEAPCLNHCRA